MRGGSAVRPHPLVAHVVSSDSLLGQQQTPLVSDGLVVVDLHQGSGREGRSCGERCAAALIIVLFAGCLGAGIASLLLRGSDRGAQSKAEGPSSEPAAQNRTHAASVELQTIGAQRPNDGASGKQPAKPYSGPRPLAPTAFVAPVFKGAGEYSCFRIPSIIRTHRGTLLAFAEGRKQGCGDDTPHDLVLRRSGDGGQTWGPLIVAVHGHGLPCHHCKDSVSNPVPLEIERPKVGKVILLHFETRNNPRAQSHGVNMQSTSRDDGLSWSRPSEIRYPPLQNKGHMVGPGIGLQNHKGRIFFSAYSWLGNFLYYSDDHGVTFRASKVIHMIGECSIAFRINATEGDILANCREGTSGHRKQVVWSEDGLPSGAHTKLQLEDPACEGSLLNDGGVLYLTNLNISKKQRAKQGRAHLTLKRSLDHGKTWDAGIYVWTGYAGYSQLVSLGNHELGVLFEAGVGGPYDTISFVRVPVGGVAPG